VQNGAATISAGGGLTVNAGRSATFASTVSLTGTITNAGTLTVSAAGTATINALGVLTNTGAVVIAGAATVAASPDAVADAITVTGANASLTVSVGGTLTLHQVGPTVTAPGGTELSAINVYQGALNILGTLVSGSGTTDQGFILTAAATVAIGGTATLTGNTIWNSQNGDIITVPAGGLLDCQLGWFVQNSSTVKISGGSMRAGDIHALTGTAILDCISGSYVMQTDATNFGSLTIDRTAKVIVRRPDFQFVRDTGQPVLDLSYLGDSAGPRVFERTY